MANENDMRIVETARSAYEKIELFGDGATAHELSDIIKEHALLGTGAAMIPVPVLDVAAIIANIWAMYVRINNVVGISFSENFLKSVASGIVANVAATIPAIGLGALAGSFLKAVPGIGTLGGIALAAGANLVIVFVAGRVYLKTLEVLVNNGKPLDEANIKREAEKIAKDKEFVKTAYAEGKEATKNQ